MENPFRITSAYSRSYTVFCHRKLHIPDLQCHLLLFLVYKFPTVMKLFLKQNTPLLSIACGPTSSDKSSLMRNRLKDSNFERQLLTVACEQIVTGKVMCKCRMCFSAAGVLYILYVLNLHGVTETSYFYF